VDGVGGLLVKDVCSTGAAPGELAVGCVASWAAGGDVVRHCNGEFGEMATVAQVTPALSDAALLRADRALVMRADPVELDIEAAHAELAALTS